MEKFKRGVVVQHKVMGRAVVIDQKGEFIHVRMQNGEIQEFYPEELETADEYMARIMSQVPKNDKDWGI